ncbi:MAG: penicillin-binding protein 2 [Candidatus Melainabacteria bacterium]|nr:penicillin-binding protein 2 [Candidatus Melainabacteria bacterium]
MAKPFPPPPKPGGKHPVRFRLTVGLFMLLAVLIVGRLVYLQVWAAHALSHKASQSRNASRVLVNRGRILDRNGTVLAQDMMLYDMYAHPQHFFENTPVQIASALAPYVDVPESQLLEKLARKDSTILLFKDLPKATVEAIQEKARITHPRRDHKTQKLLRDKESGRILTKDVPISGLDPVKKPVRRYPQGALAAHVLGYVNDEAQLFAGIEDVASDILRESPGGQKTAGVSVDGRGNPITLDKTTLHSITSAPKAQDVTLTIDARLQFAAEKALASGIERTGAERGVVVMMAPKSGEVLAYAVSPTYHPEQFRQAPAGHLKNWSLSDVYPPGSTMKILTVACGLEAGAIEKHSRLLDTGKMKIGGWTITNYDYWKHPHPGMVDLVYLFQHSSNIASAKVALLTPKNKHYTLLDRFGFGRKTGIDLPGESAGILHSPKTWDTATQASMGYGYGLAATPMQMAAAVASIANGGVWVTPHVLKNPGKTKVVRRRVLSEQTAKDVTDLLASAIEQTPNSPVALKEVRVAGKTGTSRKPREAGRGYGASLYTSFVGYFPAERPEVLIMVVVDSPTKGAIWGSTVAAPIFAEIAEQTVHILGLATHAQGKQPYTSPTH